MTRSVLVILALVSLSACKPDITECSDYRWMTFSEYGPLGWTDIHATKVCVLTETKAQP